ncbi:hypothetical protein Tco_1238575 [Tanacetum coccineum]
MPISGSWQLGDKVLGYSLPFPFWILGAAVRWDGFDGSALILKHSFNLAGVNMNALSVNHMPKEQYFLQPEFTLREFCIQSLLLEQFQDYP